MFSWLFGEYFYKYELINLIDKIDTKRKFKRIKGETMNSTFADDLKNALNGIQLSEQMGAEQIKKSNSDSIIHYTNKEEENIKLYVEKQFKNA